MLTFDRLLLAFSLHILDFHIFNGVFRGLIELDNVIFLTDLSLQVLSFLLEFKIRVRSDQQFLNAFPTNKSPQLLCLNFLNKSLIQEYTQFVFEFLQMENLDGFEETLQRFDFDLQFLISFMIIVIYRL